MRDALASASQAARPGLTASPPTGRHRRRPVGLLPGEDARTPEAALLALRRRHTAAEADEVVSAVLLSTTRAAVPWLGPAAPIEPG